MSLEHSPARQGNTPPVRLADDLLTGIRAIAQYTGESERRTEYLVACGLIPAFKIGARVCARKSELDEAFSSAAKPAA
jgi:hypothetical protein